MPYRIDLYAVFIFLGIVQGIFLLVFFFSKENRRNKSNVFHGLMLFSIVACVTEIFLMYSGYIIHVLYLVDFSEVFGLLIGPFFYLLVLSYTRGDVSKKQYLHLVFPAIYLLLQTPFLILPEDAKYNAWIGTYHPDWEYRQFDYKYDPRMFWLTDHCTEISLINLALYGVLGIYEILRVFREKKESFFRPVNPILKFLRWETFQVLSAVVGIFAVKLFNKEDTGDHLFAAYITVIIYFTSFRIIKSSGFFKPVDLVGKQKYKSSTITADAQQELLQKLKTLMVEKKPFLRADFSLPELAKQLNTTLHILSQVINEGLGKTFFEMMAEYRVAEARLLLKQYPNIKVEEIAEQVGYNSKSAFNTSFKKYTGMTPSAYRGTVNDDV